MIPRPLGVNPLLTISAIAERGTALLAAVKGWEIDYDLDGGAAPSPEPAATRASKPGLRFTEKMSGFWAPASRPAADLEDYEEGEGSGAKAARSITFVLTLATDDLGAVTASLATPMTAMGTVVIPDISTEPTTVEGGSFELLVADDELDHDVRHMRYHLPLVAVCGARYHMDGFKLVRPGTVTEAWPDTSTLYVTLRAEGATGDVVGLGVLHIQLEDFCHQLRTMTVTGPVSQVERLELLEALRGMTPCDQAHLRGHEDLTRIGEATEASRLDYRVTEVIVALFRHLAGAKADPHLDPPVEGCVGEHALLQQLGSRHGVGAATEDRHRAVAEVLHESSARRGQYSVVELEVASAETSGGLGADGGKERGRPDDVGEHECQVFRQCHWHSRPVVRQVPRNVVSACAACHLGYLPRVPVVPVVPVVGESW